MLGGQKETGTRPQLITFARGFRNQESCFGNCFALGEQAFEAVEKSGPHRRHPSFACGVTTEGFAWRFTFHKSMEITGAAVDFRVNTKNNFAIYRRCLIPCKFVL